MKRTGELLYEEMKKADGMTQKKLDDKVGIDRSMISRYINGHDEISIEERQHLHFECVKSQ